MNELSCSLVLRGSLASPGLQERSMHMDGGQATGQRELPGSHMGSENPSCQDLGAASLHFAMCSSGSMLGHLVSHRYAIMRSANS